MRVNGWGRFNKNSMMGVNALYARLGIPCKGTGDIFVVKKSTDADFEQVRTMLPSGDIFTTIAEAEDACTAGAQDVVAICPATWTENLTMAKADVSYIGLGNTPYSVVIDGDGSIAVTITGVDVSLKNLHILTAGAAVACVYGTGLVGAPVIEKCYFNNATLTSIGLINIAGAASRGLVVRDNTFFGASTNADAVNYAGKAGACYNNTAEGLNQTESACFGVNGQVNNEAGS